jgi:hypothetical protein
MSRKRNKPQFNVDILKYTRPSLVFHIDLDTIAGENEEYELVWEKLELALLNLLNNFSRSDKKAVSKQSFYLWGQLGNAVNSAEHLCNAYFIYLIPETELNRIEETITQSFEESEISWSIEEIRSLDEECVPLFKYEHGAIIRYIFDQIAEDGREDLGCSNIEFITWDGDWHICLGAYPIDMSKNTVDRCLTNGKKVTIIYRKFSIEPEG